MVADRDGSNTNNVAAQSRRMYANSGGAVAGLTGTTIAPNRSAP
jgi:hypothetical protein